MKTKWFDIRLFQPNPNHYHRVLVTYNHCGMILTGLGEWLPMDGYTKGRFIKVTTKDGNSHWDSTWPDVEECPVLYWAKFEITAPTLAVLKRKTK